MIHIDPKHRNIANLYHGGQFSQLYHVGSSGMVAERDMPVLVREVRECIQIAQEQGDTDGETGLRSLLNEVLSFDTFEFNN